MKKKWRQNESVQKKQTACIYGMASAYIKRSQQQYQRIVA